MNTNFTLFLPKQMPSEWQEIPKSQSYREELPPYNMQDPSTRTAWSNWSGIHNSSYKTDFMHRSGSIIRCKQYLYDLGPLSASDHAALYDHFHWRLGHRISGDRIYWHGYDYAVKPALTFQDSGTNIELRVVQGEVSTEELITLAEHLQPENDLLNNTPFAEKSYWSRYPRYDLNLYIPDSQYKIPSSLWKLRWPLWQAEHRWELFEKDLVSDVMNRILQELRQFGFESDSICTFGEQLEVQLFLKHKQHPNIHGWLRRLNSKSSPLKQPRPDRLPEMDSFSGFTGFGINVLESSKFETPIYIASVSKEIGPFDIIWWDKGHMYLVQIVASTEFDLKKVLLLAERIEGNLE